VIKLTENLDERIEELKREIEQLKKENEIAKLEKELADLKDEEQKIKKVPQPSRISTPEPVIPIGIVRVTAYAVPHDQRGNDLGGYFNSISATRSATSKKKSGILPIRAAYAAPHDNDEDMDKVIEELNSPDDYNNRRRKNTERDINPFRTMSYCAPHDKEE
jgi:hypothetical protein